MLKKTCTTELHLRCDNTEQMGDVVSKLKAKDMVCEGGVHIPYHAVNYAVVSCETEEIQITDQVCAD